MSNAETPTEEGYFTLAVPTKEPFVILGWGDGTATNLFDDSPSALHDYTDLQIALMVTRLRYIADALVQSRTTQGETT